MNNQIEVPTSIIRYSQKNKGAGGNASEKGRTADDPIIGRRGKRQIDI